jgi:hypothetical protein
MSRGHGVTTEYLGEFPKLAKAKSAAYSDLSRLYKEYPFLAGPPGVYENPLSSGTLLLGGLVAAVAGYALYAMGKSAGTTAATSGNVA